MKNTNKKICTEKKDGYDVYKTVWEHEGKFYIKDGKEKLEVFKSGSGFLFAHQLRTEDKQMGAKYTEGQARATEKYMSDKHTIRVVVTKEKAEEYKKLAADAGKSLNQFIIECIENRQ